MAALGDAHGDALFAEPRIRDADEAEHDGVARGDGVTAKDYGDLMGGRDVGLQRNTGYREFDGDARLRKPLGEDSDATVFWQRVHQGPVGRTDPTVDGVAWRGTVPGTDKERRTEYTRELAALRWTARDLSWGLDRVLAAVSWQTLEEEQYRKRANLTGERQGLRVRTLGAQFQAEQATRAGLLTWGVDYYRDGVDSFRRTLDTGGRVTSEKLQGPVADDASYDNLGAYAQTLLPLGTAPFELVLGGRFSHLRASAGTVEDPVTGAASALAAHWNSVVGNARLLWKVAPGAVLYAGVSQGLRAPNLSDLTRFDIVSSAAEQESPSPDLKPERFLNYEVGARRERGAWRTEAAAFYMQISDLIIRAPTGRKIGALDEVTKRNSGQGFVTGAEAGIAGPLGPWDGFSWVLEAAMQYSEHDAYPTAAPVTQREPMDKSSPPSGRGVLRWQNPSGARWAETVVESAGKARRLSSRDNDGVQRIPPGGTPGYTVLTFRGGADLGRGLSVSAAVENVSNLDYRRHSSGLNEPGTNFVLTTRWRFQGPASASRLCRSSSAQGVS